MYRRHNHYKRWHPGTPRTCRLHTVHTLQRLVAAHTGLPDKTDKRRRQCSQLPSICQPRKEHTLLLQHCPWSTHIFPHCSLGNHSHRQHLSTTNTFQQDTLHNPPPRHHLENPGICRHHNRYIWWREERLSTCQRRNLCIHSRQLLRTSHWGNRRSLIRLRMYPQHTRKDHHLVHQIPPCMGMWSFRQRFQHWLGMRYRARFP